MAESLAPVALQDSVLLLVLLSPAGTGSDEETAVVDRCLHLYLLLESDLES